MTTKENSNSKRKTAIIVGVLILFAYAAVSSAIFESVIVVMLLEIMSGVAVIAIAALMAPLLKPYNEKLALGYLVCRIIEGLPLIIAGMLLLSSHPLVSGIRNWITGYHAYIFIPASLLLYWLLYQSQLVPRFISIWGFIAIAALLIVNMLEITGHNSAMANVLYLPIVTNEVSLAIWLIAKGFNASAIVSKKEVGTEKFTEDRRHCRTV